MSLHLAPQPMLLATTGASIPYDWRLNFLSELVRTQYGPAMTANFVLLAIACACTAFAFRHAALPREAWLLAGCAAVFALLALLPSDLAELRTDASTCGDPARIEPCTWVGRAHDVLPNALFVLIGLTCLSLFRRKTAPWRRVVMAAGLCAAGAIVLVVLAALYVQAVAPSGRVWVGLLQRAVVVPGIGWLCAVNAGLA